MRSKIIRFLPYLWILFVASMALLIQFHSRVFLCGIDSYFHMSVTYDAYQQIRTSHYSYFLTLFGFHHCGRIVNTVYGPLGGYFSGLILLITGSWFHWQIVLMFLLLFIAGVSMYQLLHSWNVLPILSSILAPLYMFSSPLIMMWFGSQYDGLGAAFLPWVLLFGSKILRQLPFHYWQLVLLFVILIEIHPFTFALAVVLLFVCWLGTLKQPQYALHLLGQLIMLGVLTLLLSFNVWGSMLEVIWSNHAHLMPTFSVNNFTSHPFDSVQLTHQISWQQNLTLLGISTTIIFVIILFMMGWRYHQLSYPLQFMGLIGVVTLWLSSAYFPWNQLADWCPLLRTALQFPRRFLPITYLTFYLIAGVLLTKFLDQHHRAIIHYCGGLGIICMAFFACHVFFNVYQGIINEQHYAVSRNYAMPQGQFRRENHDELLQSHVTPQQLKRLFMEHDPEKFFQFATKSTPDYLPSSAIIQTNRQYHHAAGYHYYDHSIMHNSLKYHFHSQPHAMQVRFTTQHHKLQVPFVKYRHTRVTLNGHCLHHVRINQVGAMTIHPRSGANTLRLKYQPALWYWIGLCFSLTIWMILIMIGIRKAFLEEHND